MSQQINLFNPAFRKKGFSFTSATAMLYGIGITIAAGTMAALYERDQLRDATNAARTIQESHTAVLARLEKLTAAAAQQKPNPQLEADVAKLDLQLKGRQEIIEALNNGAVGNLNGFSEYMRAFSRQSLNGLWLTGFDIAQGGNELAINGRTVNADLVSEYLDHLNREKPLQGRQFAALRIGQPAVKAADAPPPANANQSEPRPAPRFLEFSISTADLPHDGVLAQTSGGAASSASALNMRKALGTAEPAK